MTLFFNNGAERRTNITRVGIDLANQVFRVTGAVVERRKLRRAGLQSYLALLPRA